MADNINSNDQERLVERAIKDFESALINYATSIIRDQEKAKDIVQETLIKLYQQDPEKVSQALKAWLFTVCRNRCFDVMRKEKRMTNMDDKKIEIIHDTADDPRTAAERTDQRIQILGFLDKLPDNQKEVIRLKFEGDMSYKEISQVTNLSVSNVGFLIHAGIKKLRVMLTDQTI